MILVVRWLEVMRVGILALSDLREKISTFHCSLWAFHIQSVLCWGKFLPYLIFWKFLSWSAVEFVQMFCIYWDDHGLLSLNSAKITYHIDRLMCTQLSLSHRNTLHWSIIYDIFDVLLNLFSWYYVEDFCVHVCQGYGPIVFLWCLCLSLVSE